METCCTQFHGLLRWVCPDACQHGAEQQGETAEYYLHTSGGAARWYSGHRAPEASITEIFWCLNEEKITEI